MTSKNNFAEEIAKYQNVESAYDKGLCAGKEAWTLMRGLNAEIDAKGSRYRKLFRASLEASKRKNPYITINSLALDQSTTVRDIVDSFREFGIDRFYVASGDTDAIDMAYAAQKSGCEIEGMALINGGGCGRAALLFRVVRE